MTGSRSATCGQPRVQGQEAADLFGGSVQVAVAGDHDLGGAGVLGHGRLGAGPVGLDPEDRGQRLLVVVDSAEIAFSGRTVGRI